ncbi:HemY-like protein [Methylophaga lonarensis MPL]|uniref:HemY-like protein n=1 Tax=Methylophaga lonarensis MPL TaxID=1286106 RepID=M7NY63_9GAMM|nr:heme biosynthesis HemY N-terminal domain-containing protein [Methylophaga lonarensis]EMR12187.1 HemY-like protein [Methylophaga lonarensis MPL]
MKMLFIVAIGLLIGALLIWAADFQPGFVLLQYGSWSLETSLVLFGLIVVVLWSVFYGLMRGLGELKQLPANLSVWHKHKQQTRASRALTRGLITLEEGRWAEAEQMLVKHAGNSDTPLLHYLAAARAAQKQNASDRRDNYLKLAHETTEGADIAVGVVQAELQLSAGQKEQALATLQHLREMAPKHPYVLQLLQQLYRDTEQWQAVQTVLPDLRKRQVLDAEAAKNLSATALVGQLQQALERQDWNRMAQVWAEVPGRLRQTEMFLEPHIHGLVAQGELDEAISLIEQFLRKDWSDALVYQYGLISSADMLRRLAIAEKWLVDHPHNPWLLLTVGRLARSCELWAKSEQYLRTSIDHGPRGETYQELAEVLRAEGNNEAAAEVCKQGLQVMLEGNTQPVSHQSRIGITTY